MCLLQAKRYSHSRAVCFKLKKKENLSLASSAPAGPVTPSTSVAAVEKDNKESNLTVALISKDEHRIIKTDNPQVKIVDINNVKCKLFALIDTGSPISFISSDVFNDIFKCSQSNLDQASSVYKAINGMQIKIVGSINSSLQLELLPDSTAKIKFHVLQDNYNAYNIILGLDFINENGLSINFSPRKDLDEDKLQLLRQVASIDLIRDDKENIDSIISDIQIDFDMIAKQKLINTIIEVEDTEVFLPENDYLVKVSLKDE